LSPQTRRVLVALGGIPLLLGCVYLGEWPLTALVALIGLLAVQEGYSLLAPGPPRSALWGLRAFALAAPIAVLLEGSVNLIPLALGAALIGIMPAMRCEPRAGARSVTAVLTLLVYPLTCLLYVLWLREESGWPMVFFLLALIWVGDTAAYEGGRRTGKRPLAPQLSPNKTIEGAIWALAGSLLVAGVAWWRWPGGRSVFWFAAAAIVVWFLGMVGDLFESLLKRAAGVKDSSRLLSEHGGVLDRFDSLFFATVGLYYLTHWQP